MVELVSHTERRDGVTFVRAVLTNSQTTAQMVGLENQLDGPTWSPRRGSVIDPAWSGDVWEDTIEPGRTRGVGFASPAPPRADEEPVAVVAVDRAADRRASTNEVLAALDDWSPTIEVLSREL